MCCSSSPAIGVALLNAAEPLVMELIVDTLTAGRPFVALLPALVGLPLVLLIGVAAAPEQARLEAWLMDQWIRLYSRINEVLTGIVTVRSFARGARAEAVPAGPAARQPTGHPRRRT